MKLPAFFEEDRALVETALKRLLPSEHAQPPTIHRAMHYSIAAGGKRIRPILCVEAADDFFQAREGALKIGLLRRFGLLGCR